ncbi:CoA binding domain-containing protein [Mycena rosella]|uniref:CoA binding domain-containing protein n=1 Tax=Mycena rosella TaxID=1033263 RepID=A0AAD7G0X3_MYCRO|nr:CoA binding domain-containing protein [Mycena rosella]
MRQLWTSTNLFTKNAASENTPLAQKEARFLSAPKFAVVGASSDTSKNGSKASALRYLIKQRKDVVPINLKASEIQGLKCLKELSELPDPTRTSVSIVVPPKVTLDIVQQAKALNIFALWLQPGAEDAVVVKFIQADAELNERSVYLAHALDVSGTSSAAAGLDEDIDVCLFHDPLPSTTETEGGKNSSDAAPLGASNLVASLKHDTLSLSELAPDDSMRETGEHILDLGEEIPGLA